MDNEKFKISLVLISLILLIGFFVFLSWYVYHFYILEFHLVILLSVPVVLFFFYVCVYNSIGLIIEQFKLLRRKH